MLWQEPVDPPPVDPFMQRQLRTNKKKTLCRGKPKKAGEPKEPKGPKKSVKNEKTKGKQAAAAPKKAAKNGKVQQAKKKPLDDDGGEGRQLGCPTCRFGRLGCKKCRNPNYRPRGPRKPQPES